MGLGFSGISLFIMWHLIFTINSILVSYGSFIQEINEKYDTTYPDNNIFFFGNGLGMRGLSIIIDILMVIIILILITMVILKLVWSIKENQK